MKTSKASSFFEREIKPENKLFVDNSLDIAVEVNKILDEYGWTQKDLAKKLGKSESEVSKWLSGLHNLTLKSISKIEAVLGRKIIEVPSRGRRKYFSDRNSTIRVEHIEKKSFHKVSFEASKFKGRSNLKVACQ
ncbi:MAG: XRE family transcriptional regulator [Saprospirales bacterium]|nr:MAG: XRE family transcriptional regulator [Saprospirales bacterium]